METPQIAKQVIGFQRTVFNNSFNALATVQDQTETMINNFIGQFPWVTAEAKKQMADSADYIKKARNDFKKAVDNGFDQFEKLVDKK